MQQTVTDRCQQAAEHVQSSRSGLCLHAVCASLLFFSLIPLQPLIGTNVAFVDRLYQGCSDAYTSNCNVALLAEVPADFFRSAQSQAENPVAEAPICTSLLPQKAWA